MIKYKNQLRTLNWKIKRFKILKRDNFCCLVCKSEDNLQVHHTKYIQGRMAWEYPDDVLHTLCGGCHIKAHENTKIPIEKSKSVKPKTKTIQKPKPIKKKKKQKDRLHGLSAADKKLQLLYDKIRNKTKPLK